MPFRRMILVSVILMQSVVILYSNHARLGMLKTMHNAGDALTHAMHVIDLQHDTIQRQESVLVQADSAIHEQRSTIDIQAKVIEKLRRTRNLPTVIVVVKPSECAGSRVAYR
jgi:hypothetical protein